MDAETTDGLYDEVRGTGMAASYDCDGWRGAIRFGQNRVSKCQLEWLNIICE